VKTSDELWRWIWEDDEVLGGDELAEVLGDARVPPLPPPPSPPSIRTEDLWEWLTRDEPLLEADPLGEQAVPEAPVAPNGTAVRAVAVVEAPPPVIDRSQPAVFLDAPETEVPPEPEVETEPEPAPVEPRRIRLTWARHLRYAAVILVAVVVGAVAPRVLPAGLDADPAAKPAAPGTADQAVVAWSVTDDRRGFAFVAVLAGGVRPPVALAVPADVTINLPGQGLGTMREAAVTGDRGLVGVALENLLGVPVDHSASMTVHDLSAAVDAAGGIVVADQQLNGPAVFAYLTDPEAGELPDERFLRWQDVLDGLLDAVASRPDVATAFPEPLRPVLAASSPERADLLALPVTELGAGLLRPDVKGVSQLVEERFVPLEGDAIRLVVLNGVGEPGIGEEVARILIPNGFRLMSSENANRFDYQVTKIVAASEEDIPSAERARDLLGAGQILLGAQPLLADVIVVVGRDFAGGR
jgi:hypothetical protein